MPQQTQTPIPSNAITGNFPEWAQDLWKPNPYLVFYGGRGAGRSYNIAQALLIQGIEKTTRNLCVREYQSAISESVHAQLETIVNNLNLKSVYDVQKSKIVSKRNGTTFTYGGITTNPESVKSTTDVDNCWVEEAESVKEKSWEFLLPTIRKPGSRIIISFNPGLVTAPTYQRFVVNPPKDAIKRLINYHDNPFLPEKLRQQAEEMKEQDYDKYRHVWLGEPLSSLVGAIYEREVANIEADGRLLVLRPNRGTETFVCADLGWSDSTVLWFIQKIGQEFFVVDYYENNQETWDHYLKYIAAAPYNIKGVILPHDSKKRTVENTGLTLYEQTIAAGFKTIHVPMISVDEGIDATRQFLARAYFNSSRCGDGFESLRRYQWEENRQGDIKRKPKHDATSHGADALRYGAIVLMDRYGHGLIGSGNSKRGRRLVDNTPS